MESDLPADLIHPSMKQHPTFPAVRRAGRCSTSPSTENKVKISALGVWERVGRAMGAANATENTKKWGQELLNRLARC